MRSSMFRYLSLAGLSYLEPHLVCLKAPARYLDPAGDRGLVQVVCQGLRSVRVG
jgi:hypothetical protein